MRIFKIIILGLFTIFELTNYAQNISLADSVEWHFGKIIGAGPSQSYDYFKVIGDTVISNKTCKKIRVECYDPAGNLIRNYRFGLYIEGLKIYYSYRDTFNLIFDYGLSIGDTIQLNIPVDYIDIEFEDLSFEGKLNNIDEINYCDSTIKQYHFKSFSSNTFTYTSVIGLNNWYFFPFDHGLNDGHLYSLNCYTSDGFKCELKTCDYTHSNNLSIDEKFDYRSSIELVRKNQELFIFSESDISEVNVYRINGAAFKTIKGNGQRNIQLGLSEFPLNTLFVIQVKSETNIKTFKFIQ